jgi:hypothetical protein
MKDTLFLFMKQHIYHTAEGDFLIPDQWKECLGEDVLQLRKTFASRLKELNIVRRYFIAMCRQLPEFLEWYDVPTQKRLTLRLRDNSLVSKHRRKTNLERYGVENPVTLKSVQDKIKRTLIDRYGADNPMKVPEIKEKAQRTIFERYGVRSTLSLQETKEKIRQTNLERFGTENPLNNQEVRAKANATIQTRFGGNPMFDKSVREKAIRTSIERYGVRNPSMVKPEEIIAFLRSRFIEPLEFIDSYAPNIQHKAKCLTCGTEYDFHFSTNGYPTVCPKCNKNSTVFERAISNLIEESGFKIKRHYRPSWLLGEEIDIFIEELSVGIEVNGALTHNSDWHPFARTPKPPTFHQNKSQKCLEHGISLLHIWEHWDKDKVLKLLKSKLSVSRQKIAARTLSVEQCNASDVRDFIQNNHIHGFLPASYYFRLVKDGEIYGAMTFRSTKDEGVLELSRLCLNSDFIILGGSEKLLKFAVSSLRPTRIVSYAYRDITPNPDKCVYKRLGFRFEGFTAPGLSFYVYKSQHIKDSEILKTGVYSRQRFQTHKLEKLFGEKGLTSSDLKDKSIFRVFDSGNLKFVLDC